MPFLQHLRPRLILLSRIMLWSAAALLVLVGIFHSAPAWAEPTTCTGNSSITPIPKLVLYLTYGGPPSTYEVELCGDPENNEDVEFTTTVSQAGLVSVNPTNFTLGNPALQQEVSVGVLPSHDADDPFTVEIEHTSESDIPGFDNVVTQVTAYYSPPVAVADRVMVGIGQVVNINVLANDIDRLGLGAGLDPAIVTPPGRGTVSVNVDKTIRYQLPAGRPGADPFIYQVEDAVDNSDSARVLVVVVPRAVNNPQTVNLNPAEGGSLPVVTEVGEGEIEVPPLVGVSPDSEVFCVFGQAATTSGDLSAKPYNPSTFTGLVFYLECYVDGEPITAAMLSGPITIILPLSADFIAAYSKTNLNVANWDEDLWQTDGINLIPGSNTSLTIQTTRLGEFAVFSQGIVRFPFLVVSE